MSAFLRAFLRCDGCGAFLRDETIPQDETLLDARRASRAYGWTRTRTAEGWLDFCPGCAHMRRAGNTP